MGKEKLCVTGKRWLALTENGINVFHVARWCGQIRLQFWFTTDLKTVFAEKDKKLPNGHFDARNLPDEYKKGDDPVLWIKSAIIDDYDLSEIYYNLD